MPNVVQKTGKSRQAVGVRKIGGREVGQLAGIDQALKAGTGEVHHAQGMLEPVVDRPGINEADEAELADVAETLDPRVVDDSALILGDEDGAVDRIADLVDGG
jgi:hypothetical protein